MRVSGLADRIAIGQAQAECFTPGTINRIKGSKKNTSLSTTKEYGEKAFIAAPISLFSWKQAANSVQEIELSQRAAR